MSFTDYHQVRNAIEEQNYATLSEDNIVDEQGLFVFYIQTNIHNNIAKTGKEYILNGIPEDVFPNKSVGLEKSGQQEYILYFGEEKYIPDSCILGRRKH